MKYSSDTMRNRTRDIPACSVVTGYGLPQVYLYTTTVLRLCVGPDTHLACLRGQQSDWKQGLIT